MCEVCRENSRSAKVIEIAGPKVPVVNIPLRRVKEDGTPITATDIGGMVMEFSGSMSDREREIIEAHEELHRRFLNLPRPTELYITDEKLNELMAAMTGAGASDLGDEFRKLFTDSFEDFPAEPPSEVVKQFIIMTDGEPKGDMS